MLWTVYESCIQYSWYVTSATDSIHHTKQHGVTALMKASRQGHVEVVETLIARQAVLDLKSHVSLPLSKILKAQIWEWFLKSS